MTNIFKTKRDEVLASPAPQNFIHAFEFKPDRSRVRHLLNSNIRRCSSRSDSCRRSKRPAVPGGSTFVDGRNCRASGAGGWWGRDDSRRRRWRRRRRQNISAPLRPRAGVALADRSPTWSGGGRGWGKREYDWHF